MSPLFQDTHPFLDTILDILPFGVYVLDDKGNYVFVNRTIAQLAGLTKQEFLKINVLHENSYEICVSQIVYDTKKPVTTFQDIDIPRTGRKWRQLITSTPVFDGNGNICNLVAVLFPIEGLNYLLHEAQTSGIIPVHTMEGMEGAPAPAPQTLVANSKAMQDILALARQVASVDSSVLIQGESGTGKEVVASYLHQTGHRSHKPFVVINCASLPENLLESELFGYEKGAFTGANASGKRGLIEEADGGTLFLDEINSMSLALQGKLLRVLETKTSRRLGSLTDRSINFRLVAACNQNLQKMCAEGTFREDLYYRLNVVPITIPPLRERIEDIVPLTNLFLSEFCNRYGKVKYLNSSAMDRILQYDWPGNVRELRNFIERLIVTTSDETTEIHEIPDAMFDYTEPSRQPEQKNYVFVGQPQGFSSYEDTDFSLKDYLEGCEKAILESILRAYGNTYKAAEILKIDQSSVVRKKNKYHIKY